MNELDDAAIAKFVEQELTRRRWILAAQPDLIPPGESFTARVIRRVNEWQVERRRSRDEGLAHDAFIHEYCHLLHQAVSRNGNRVQQMALQETINFAWPAALKRCANREMAESAILRAVNKIWMHIDRCQPGSYLAFFGRILQNEINQELRNQRRAGREVMATDLPAEDDADELGPDALESLAAGRSQGNDAYAVIDLEESRPSLFTKLRGCLKHAHKEFVIRAVYWGELQVREIAQLLCVTATQVTQWKSRSLAIMRERCPDVVQELLLLLSP